jgi:hypothetical protein
VSLSLAHLRRAQNEAGKFVLDGDVETVAVCDDAAGAAFLHSLALAGLPHDSLWHLYQGWLDRLTALEAAALTGAFAPSPTVEAARARRSALREIARLDGELAGLRARAEKEPQLNRRVELNLAIRRLAAERRSHLTQLG